MTWLNQAVDKIEDVHPEGEVIVSSGVSPSGKYHLGTLREVLTAEALMLELRRRGRQARHLHIVDDLDVLRKIPAGVDEKYSKYLGKPLCDSPAPDGSDKSWADYYLGDLLAAAKDLHLEMEVVRSHEKYRAGFFGPAIESALENLEAIKEILADVSGRQLDERWSPVQVVEKGYLKSRHFVGLDKQTKKLTYADDEGNQKTVSYADGVVKLNWRIDWPARWWLLNVQAEPFGRDHATKGGSYDTGAVIVKKIFGAQPPLPLPYEFINRTGETKKMSKSAGDTITITELLEVLPAEVVRFFILRYPPSKTLFFDAGPTMIRLVDEFAELLAKPEKSNEDEQLLELCLHGIKQPVVSGIPFSHLVASYQAALMDPAKTIEIIERTEHGTTAEDQRDVIVKELKFIDQWLKRWAPADIKFEPRPAVDPSEFDAKSTAFLSALAVRAEAAPAEADGEWFHKAIYDLKDEFGLTPQEMFGTIYKVLIDKTAGPRAGWFLSILPRDWLIKRLRLEA